METVSDSGLARRLGLEDDRAAAHLVSQIAAPTVVRDEASGAAGTLALIEEVGPRSALESMLVTQAVAVHNAAMASLTHATQHSGEYADRAAARAGRLGRLFLDQLEALARLRGKPPGPGVTVGQVNVHDGGQAIVGAITATPKPRELPSGEAEMPNV